MNDVEEITAYEARAVRAAVLTLAIALQTAAPLLISRAQAAQAQLCFALTGEKGKSKPGAHLQPCMHATRRQACKPGDLPADSIH